MFDYLVDELSRTATSPVSDVVLRACLSSADTAEIMRVGTTARVHARYQIALDAYAMACLARTAASGADHPSTLTSRSYLASMMFSLGRIDEAAAEQAQVLAGFGQILGLNHPSTLTCRENLAVTLHSQGEFERARLEQEAVLAGFRRLHGPSHPSTLTSLSNLAVMLSSLGLYEEAVTDGEAVLSGFTDLLGRKHPRTIRAEQILASLRRHT